MNKLHDAKVFVGLILHRTKRARRKALADRYRRTAHSYGEMAAVTGTSAIKPVPWLEYCRILQLVYQSHAEEVEKLS